MGPFAVSLYVVGSVSLTFAALSLAVASLRPHSRLHLWFGLTALAAATNAFVEPLHYRALTVDVYAPAVKAALGIQALWWMMLVGFLCRYAEGLVRRRLALAVAG